jgi:formiminotetrahydrofolate cyclodeaminase
VAPSTRYLDLTLAGWLDELASAEPVPGGGSALAVAAAMAAGVLAMAARLSGDPALAAQAEVLRARAAPLAERGAEAYAAALGARERAAALKPERRDWEIGRAFAAAAAPPLELARAAVDIAELAAELAQAGDPRIRADALAAASLGAAVAHGAAALVAVNLTTTARDPRLAEAQQLAEAAARAAARVH